jgi:hypothetical protein
VSVGEGFFSSFFLTRATPRRRALWVGRADRRPPSGRDRGRACAERSSARGGKRHVGALRTSRGGVPVAAAEFCVVVCCGCGGGVKQNIKKSLPHTHTQPVPRLSPLSYLIMNIISPRKELASPLPVHTTHTLHPYTSGRVRTRHDRRGLDRYSHVLSTHGPASPEKREGHAQPGDSLDYLHPRAGTAGHLSDGRSQHRVPRQK